MVQELLEYVLAPAVEGGDGGAPHRREGGESEGGEGGEDDEVGEGGEGGEGGTDVVSTLVAAAPLEGLRVVPLASGGLGMLRRLRRDARGGARDRAAECHFTCSFLPDADQQLLRRCGATAGLPKLERR